MIGQVGSLPLPEFVESAMNGSGLLPDTLRDPNRGELVQHLATFSDFVAAEVARRPKLRLSELLDTLQQMDDNRLELPIRSHLDQVEAVPARDRPTAPKASSSTRCGCWIAPRTSGAPAGANGAASSACRIRCPTPAIRSEEEARRRLFFVALTRAKTEVVMSVADLDDRGRTQERVAFIDELLAGTDLSVEPGGLARAEITRLAETQLQAVDTTTLPGLEALAIADLIAEFRLSVSALYAYLDCPTRFFYEKLLKVPDRETRGKPSTAPFCTKPWRPTSTRMRMDPARIFPSKEELLFKLRGRSGADAVACSARRPSTAASSKAAGSWRSTTTPTDPLGRKTAR